MTINDIVQKVFFLTKTDSTQFVASDMLIFINNAYDRVASLVIKADAKWQWDDSNNTDLPIATTALVANQRDYSLATSHLEILRARVKDTSGNWTVLKSKDVRDPDYVSAMDSTTTGIPTYYDKFGTSVFLGLTPSYSQSASLELTFQRGAASFTSGEVSTGTKVPGFSSLYHELIPLIVSYDYWLINDQNMCGGFMKKIDLLEAQIVADYAGRNKDEKNRLIPNVESNK